MFAIKIEVSTSGNHDIFSPFLMSSKAAAKAGSIAASSPESCRLFKASDWSSSSNRLALFRWSLRVEGGTPWLRDACVMPTPVNQFHYSVLSA